MDDDHQLKHHLHAQHSLSFIKAVEEDDRVHNRVCYGCIDIIHGSVYACLSCSGSAQIVMHKSCAELPPEIHRDALHPHPLRFIFYDVIVCDRCGGISPWFISYKCIRCRFSLDFGCAVAFCNDDEQLNHEALQKGSQFKTKIHHFSHSHPLTRFHFPTTKYGMKCFEALRKVINFEANCMACKKKPQEGTTTYTCLPCKFFLHESCLNHMPKHVRSSFHPQHILLPRTIPKSSSHQCIACWQKIKGISFCCNECDVNLHLSCAEYHTRAIKHSSHPHHLLLHLGKSITTEIPCDACPKEDCGDFFGCTKCHFRIHVECISLPAHVDHIRHMHELVLTRFFIEDDTEEYYCDMCEKERNPEHHVYYCQECTYIAHVDCVVPELVEPAEMFLDRQQIEENSHKLEGSLVENEKMIQKDALHPHPLTLNDDVEAIFVCDGCGELACGLSYSCNLCQFNLDTKCVGLNNDEMTKKGGEIKATISHFSHSHQLIRCKITDLQLDRSCKACKQGSCGLMYVCLFCEFVLHESCLEGMPMQIQSQFHPQHLLSFLYFGDRREPCDVCNEENQFFYFHCWDCKIGMHYSCAIYKTREVKHDSHVHSLVHLGKSFFVNKSPKCDACGAKCENTLFGCIKCKFYTHLECIRLPYVVKHKRHMHSLTLTNSVIEDDTGNYYCDVCETERNPEHDVYYCKDCNYIAHIHCLINSEVEALEEIFEYLVPRPRAREVQELE